MTILRVALDEHSTAKKIEDSATLTNPTRDELIPSSKLLLGRNNINVVVL